MTGIETPSAPIGATATVNAPRGCLRSPLREALAAASPATVRRLCKRSSLPPARLARLGPGTAGWLKREIAEAVDRPVAELFREDE